MMTGTQSLSVDFRTDAWGRGALQRDDHPALPLRRLAGRRRPPTPAPGWSPPRWPPGWSATVRAGWSGSAPTATGRAARPGGHRLRRGQLVPGQGGRAAAPGRGLPPHPGGEGGPRPAGRAPSTSGSPSRTTRASTSRSSAAPGRSPAAASSTPTPTRSASGWCCPYPSWPQSGVRPEELIADLKAHPGHRPAAAGVDLARVRRPPDPRRRLRHHAGAGRRRAAGRRRRRSHDPGRRALARGRQLRHRFGLRRRPGRRPGPRRRATARRPGSPPTAPTWRASSSSPTTSACARPRPWSCPNGCSSATPGLLCDLAEGMFTVTNPTPKPGGLALTRRTAARHGVSLRHLAGDTLRGLRIFG